MYGLLTGIILFVCILLILIVLVQNPKGGGLASSFSSSNQYMGVKRTADFIEKATWGLAGGLFLLCVLVTILPRNISSQRQSKIQDQIENTAIDPERLPSYPTAPATEPATDQQQKSQPQQQNESKQKTK
jgi:preprotein translocase subunit SecG